MYVYDVCSAMHVCAHVCICVSMYVCMHVHIFYLSTDCTVGMHELVCVRVCVCVCVYVHMCVRMCTLCMCVRVL